MIIIFRPIFFRKESIHFCSQNFFYFSWKKSFERKVHFSGPSFRPFPYLAHDAQSVSTHCGWKAAGSPIVKN